MKDLIYKISIHILISWLLTHLEYLIFLFGGQTIPLGRLVQTEMECKSVKIFSN